jgi:hypothetical protein
MTNAVRCLWSATWAALMILLLSSAPQLASAMLGVDECCSMECEGSFGAERCPPNCTQGACAKMLPALVETSEPGAHQQSTGVLVVPELEEPRLAPVAASVFHPPKE